MAVRGTAQDAFPPGANVALEGGSAIEQVLRTGRPAHIENYDSVGGQLGTVMRKLGAGWAAAGLIVVDGRLWGAMTVNSGSSGAYPAGAEQRVAQFAELVSTAISNIESRARVEQLAAEQAALRRVAELVAQQAPPDQVFALVTQELSLLLGARLIRTVRSESDGTTTVVASLGKDVDRLPPGTSVTWPRGSVTDEVLRTSRPARLDDYARLRGPIAAILHEEGVRCAAGGPIIVDGRLWGAMVVASDSVENLPPGSEDRVAQFAELVSTAISNIESRAKVERLAAEQSALRRVATLVAREHSPEDLFATLVEELGVLLQVDATAILRYEADASATVVAGWSDGTITLPVGERLPLEGENLARRGAPHGIAAAQGGLQRRAGGDRGHRARTRHPFRGGQPDRGRGSDLGSDRRAFAPARGAPVRYRGADCGVHAAGRPGRGKCQEPRGSRAVAGSARPGGGRGPPALRTRPARRCPAAARVPRARAAPWPRRQCLPSWAISAIGCRVSRPE